jgi:hypothetical protein
MTASPHGTTAARRRKSGHGNQDGGVCAEVAGNLPGTVPVRGGCAAARNRAARSSPSGRAPGRRP